MLIDFRIENHRSLRDEQVLTMREGRVGEAADPRPRAVEGFSERLLPAIALYGANASGKSNVLDALSFMRDAVFESHRAWPPDGGVPRDPFAWGPKRMESSLFEVIVLIAGIQYEYGFTATDESFAEEWLYAWPFGKKQTWFEREGSDFKFGDNLKGENKVIQEITRPNALFLSAAAQNRHAQLSGLFEWFARLESFNISSRRRSTLLRPPSEFFVARLLDVIGDELEPRQPQLFSHIEPRSLLDEFRQMLRNADIGIVDLRRAKREGSESPRRLARWWFSLKHQSSYEDAWLSLDEESRGTQTLFRLALPILEAIHYGGVLLIDELEASLHPALAQKLVQLFNDPATNSSNGQLIFTTHDTNLLGTTLGEPALRRDQVWFTEKDREGGTVLYPLTDYQPRKAENLERGYLQGRYGAIPFLGDFTTLGDP
jgi:uncharacterized protein